MKKRVYLLILILGITSAFAGEGKTFLKKIRANYENLASCESSMVYKVFRGFESETPVEEYNGYFCRIGENSYRKIHKSDYINCSEKDIFLQVDHANREMILTNAISEQMFETDLETALKMCGNIGIDEKTDHFVFSLYLNKSHELPYSRIDLTVDKNFWIQCVTVYYASQRNFSKNFNHPEMDYVKMSIEYKNFKPTLNELQPRMNAEEYLSIQNEAYVPAALYANYSIVDLRKK